MVQYISISLIQNFRMTGGMQEKNDEDDSVLLIRIAK